MTPFAPRRAPRLALVLALLPTLLSGTAARADDASTPATARDVTQEASRLERDLMSPYCPGRTIADCPSPNAAVLRDAIRTELARGTAPEEVVAELEQRFGPEILGRPQALWGWLGPPVALVAGVGLTVLWLRRNARRRTDGPPGPPATSRAAGPGADPELDALLDRELADRASSG